MKRRRLWIAPVGVVAVALLLLLFTDLIPIDIAPLLPKLRLQRSETFSTSTVTLEAVRDLYSFTTVEYVHSAIFPHDYYVEGATSRDISRAMRRPLSEEQVAALPEGERLQYQTLELAVAAGLDIGSHDFLVVTVVVTAGFDLENSAFLQPAENNGTAETMSENGFRVEVIRTPDGDMRRAIIAAPMPAITGIRVEDVVPEEYPYPDVTINADSWRRVAEFVEARVMSMPQIDELRDIADRNGRDFVRKVLLSAGYDEIVFE